MLVFRSVFSIGLAVLILVLIFVLNIILSIFVVCLIILGHYFFSFQGPK